MAVLDAPTLPTSATEEEAAGRPLSLAERADLLEVARWALAITVSGRPDLALATRETSEAVAEERTGAAFVTLREGGELRGCIGVLDPARPLRRSVALAAVGAAIHDWRFRPVAEFELPAIELELSVLGPISELADPLTFRLGEDGLLVARGASRGLLLPEVATACGFDHVAMLEATCRKAGLPTHSWCLPGTTVSAFRTDRFGGPVLAGR